MPHQLMRIFMPRRNKSPATRIGPPTSRSQRGFSMVEILVSLLLMTIGLLGISGLLLSGVNNSTGIDLSSRASQSANQIIDAMRANSSNVTLYETDWGTDPTSLSGTSPADTDRKQWLLALNQLPGGDGKIEAVAGMPGQFQISIRFANCLGSISNVEANNCKSVSNNNEKRVISFLFRI